MLPHSFKRVYSKSRIASKYLRYYLTASNGKGHGVHSPFVFEFITKILNDSTAYPAYDEIEKSRLSCLGNESTIIVKDLGAGSGQLTSETRTVRSIARHSVKPKKFGQLLYRIVKHYRPSIIVELGTSLGLTTAYLAKANPDGKVISFEGAEEILSVAESIFRDLKLHNIRTITGNFDNTLSPEVDRLSSVDFAFIDGNHRFQPTTQYFTTLLRKTNNSSIIILDDIHWSQEMEEAWKYCKDHPSVTLSMDLFFIGILVFRKEIREKQHFVIRF